MTIDKSACAKEKGRGGDDCEREVNLLSSSDSKRNPDVWNLQALAEQLHSVRVRSGGERVSVCLHSTALTQAGRQADARLSAHRFLHTARSLARSLPASIYVNLHGKGAVGFANFGRFH